MNPLSALLVLKDGRPFFGRSFEAEGEAFRELALFIGVSGYQETLTDPPYRGQVVLATVPHIGNTSWDDEDSESARIQVAGYMVRNPAPRPSNWHSRRSPDVELVSQGIAGICSIDTRALTRHIRFLEVVRVGIPTRELNSDRLCAKVLEQPVMASVDPCSGVSTSEAWIVPAVGERRFTVAAMDLDIKGMIPAQTADHDIGMYVLSTSTSFEEAAALEPNEVFFSNGPGDLATADGPMTVPRRVLTAGTPYFEICSGSQLFGRALKFGTYKLKFGHRGTNQSVLDRTTGGVEIISWNHGFAVDAPLDQVVDTEFGQAGAPHTGLSGDVVKDLGLRRDGKLVAFFVQYHLEAMVGPHGANYLFDRFADLIRSRDAR